MNTWTCEVCGYVLRLSWLRPYRLDWRLDFDNIPFTTVVFGCPECHHRITLVQGLSSAAQSATTGSRSSKV